MITSAVVRIMSLTLLALALVEALALAAFTAIAPYIPDPLAGLAAQLGPRIIMGGRIWP